jgi:hypothetical protein
MYTFLSFIVGHTVSVSALKGQNTLARGVSLWLRKRNDTILVALLPFLSNNAAKIT